MLSLEKRIPKLGARGAAYSSLVRELGGDNKFSDFVTFNRFVPTHSGFLFDT